MIKVSIASPQHHIRVERGHYRKAVRTVLEAEGIKSAEISLAFVDNATIRRLNRQFLDHDEPTDVLSFPFHKAGTLEGELVIGAEVALAEAQSRGHDVQAELTLYIVHGLLHLCGYDDHTERDAKEMRRREGFHLEKLRLPQISPH
jgi:probable rRNA maturation factor